MKQILQKIMKQIIIKSYPQIKKEYMFYFLLFISILIIIKSTPFLKIPYDVWHHLMGISGWFHYKDTFPVAHETTWHKIWANFFSYLNISDFDIWVKVIHCTQFAFAIFASFYFTKTILKLFLFKIEVNKKYINLISLIAAWLFVFGTGTFSVQYTMSWILWYSINYQGYTLPAHFIVVALFINLLLNTELSKIKTFIHICLIIIMSLSILIIHPLEALYIMIYCLTAIFIFIDELYKKILKYKILFLFLIIFLITIPLSLKYLVTIFNINVPYRDLTPYLNIDLKTLMSFIDKAKIAGMSHNNNNIHRGFSTFTELGIMGIILAPFSIILFKIKYQYKKHLNNYRLLIWLLICMLLFSYIPRNDILAGIFSKIIVFDQVYRLIYASPHFISLAIFLYLIIIWQNNKNGFFLLLCTIIMPIFVSKYATTPHASYEMIKSIFVSLELRQKDSWNVSLPQEPLDQLIQQIRNTPTITGKKNIFCIRHDLQAYIRVVTGVYTTGDRFTMDDCHSLQNSSEWNAIKIKVSDKLIAPDDTKEFYLKYLNTKL